MKKNKDIKEQLPDLLNTRTGRYFVARQTHKTTKKEAAIIAGYPDGSNVGKIEDSKRYKQLEQVFFKDELLKQISLQTIAEELIKNISQDQDKGAKNKAIELALSKIEDKIKEESEEKVLVILRN